MNAALYIRVSTEDQMELSPDSQRKLLLEYAKKNDFGVLDEHIFTDEGISGKKAEKRPEFMKMIALAKSKKKPFGKILVWKFSRFARNQEESIVYKNMLRKDGIDVISVSEPIIEGPFGSLIERIIEWMDEYYSIRLSSEVHRGMTEKARRGGVQASPALGYDIVDNKYVVNDEEAKIIKMIYDKFLAGNRHSEIASILNTCGFKNKKGNRFEGRVVKYILENPVYCGMVRWNYSTSGRGKIKDENEWIIAEGTHKPIITKDCFYKVQELMKRNTNKFADRKPTTEYKHWLGGLLRCANCGTTLTYSAYSKSSLAPNSKYLGYFICNKYKKKSCDVKNQITIKQAEEVLSEKLREDVKLFKSKRYSSLNIAYPMDNSSEVDLLRKQLEKIPDKIKKAKDLYMQGIDTLEEFSDTKNELLKEKSILEGKLESISKQEIDNKQMVNNINTALDLIAKGEDKLVINKFLKTFISKIIIDSSHKTFDIQYIATLYST